MRQIALPLGATLVAMLAACQTAPAEPPAPAAPAAPPAAPALSDTDRAAAQVAIEALAAELGIARDQISVQSVTAVDWGDSSLGCPKPDMAYLSVVTHGHRVILLADGKLHNVHEANNQAFVCRQPKPSKSPAAAGASLLPFGPQLQRARQDLARRLGVPEDQIRAGNVTPASWEDASLGCPEPDALYAQVVTTGWVMKLRYGNREYQYHADAERAIPCPPITGD